MTRGLFIVTIFSFVFFLILLISPVLAIPVEISGRATSSQANVSISVENIGPKLTIFSPKENRTYRNNSILLNYYVFDPEDISLVWYNLNDGNNISLGNNETGSLYFNISEGNHTLYLFANDTLGLLNSTNVDFFANNTKIIVIYETFRTEKKGNSTDFDSLTDEELENLSNMTLENTDFGKIIWNEIINITDDENSSDKITTLDYNATISSCFIFINETKLSNLDKQATLWFYNLTFITPRVLRNGKVCPSSICSNQNYFGGTLSVDVTDFTNYTVEEKPGGGGGSAPTPGGTTSGGGLIPTPESVIGLNINTIKVSLIPGETKTEYLKISNNGEEKLNIIIDIINIEDLVKISEKEFVLNPGQSKTIILDFITNQETVQQTYVGKLLIKTDKVIEEVLITIEVKFEKSLLDIRLEIPQIIKFEHIISFIALIALLIAIILLILRKIKKVKIKNF